VGNGGTLEVTTRLAPSTIVEVSVPEGNKLAATTSAAVTISADATLTISANVAITTKDKITVDSGKTLTVAGEVAVSGNVVVSGTYIVDSSASGSHTGEVTVKSGGVIRNDTANSIIGTGTNVVEAGDAVLSLGKGDKDNQAVVTDGAITTNKEPKVILKAGATLWHYSGINFYDNAGTSLTYDASHKTFTAATDTAYTWNTNADGSNNAGWKAGG
jgi:hypothetical protein